MCVCVYVCIYILYCLYIYYLCRRSLFKTPLHLFLWKYSSREITDLSLCLVSFSDSSGPFLWPHGGLQCNAPTSAMRGLGPGGPDSFSWCQLLVHLRPAAQQQISHFIPSVCLTVPCSDGSEEGHWDTCGMQSTAPAEAELPVCCTGTALPPGKSPSLPGEPGPEISASCWQCPSSEVARHRGLFWLTIGQDLIEMKVHFSMCRNLNQHWAFLFSPRLRLILWNVQNFWSRWWPNNVIKLSPHCPLPKKFPEVLFIISHITKQTSPFPSLAWWRLTSLLHQAKGSWYEMQYRGTGNFGILEVSLPGAWKAVQFQA